MQLWLLPGSQKYREIERKISVIHTHTHTVYVSSHWSRDICSVNTEIDTIMKQSLLDRLHCPNSDKLHYTQLTLHAQIFIVSTIWMFCGSQLSNLLDHLSWATVHFSMFVWCLCDTHKHTHLHTHTHICILHTHRSCVSSALNLKLPYYTKHALQDSQLVTRSQQDILCRNYQLHQKVTSFNKEWSMPF